MNRVLLCVLLAGCAGKSQPGDDFTDLQGVDTKSDAFSKKMKIVGAISPGQTSSTVRYSKTPVYRAFTLAAKGEATLDFWVHSKAGDSVAWLLDSKFKILAVNDDADSTTYDSHITYSLPAGGANYYIVFRDYSYASHNFTVEVKPLAIGSGSCDIGFDVPDEPPAPESSLQALFGSHGGSYQLYIGSEPACLDWSSSSVRSAVAEDVRANSGIDWQDATPPVVVASPKKGGADFAAALTGSRGEQESYAFSKPDNVVFNSNWPDFDANVTSVLADSATNPSAFVEFHLHVEAEECSQEGWVRIDTRTGEVLILRVHGC
jgi:hypothetical protein